MSYAKDVLNEILYEKILKDIGSIFKELYKIVKSISENFEEENKQHPTLTLRIVDYHLDIVKKYNGSYQNNSLQITWSLEKNIKYTKEDLRSFYSEFENPFVGSQKWYQRISELLYQLSDESRELDIILGQISNKA